MIGRERVLRLMIVIVGTLIGVLVARRRGPASALLDGTLMIPYVIPGIDPVYHTPTIDSGDSEPELQPADALLLT